MSEQQTEDKTVPIRVLPADRERIKSLCREVAADEDRDMTIVSTVTWMLDRIDAADLP